MCVVAASGRGACGSPIQLRFALSAWSCAGFMSNRGRQNVASYLILDLGVDWRKGAEYFESLLIDYDCASNWGNWVAAAGLTGTLRLQLSHLMH